MHSRHKPRLDRFSVTVKLTATDGKRYNTIVYNHRGLYGICRWSEQPNADAFYDPVYDLLESIRKGDAKVVNMTDYQKMMAETREVNIRIRKAWHRKTRAGGHKFYVDRLHDAIPTRR